MMEVVSSPSVVRMLWTRCLDQWLLARTAPEAVSREVMAVVNRKSCLVVAGAEIAEMATRTRFTLLLMRARQKRSGVSLRAEFELLSIKASRL